MLTLTPPSPYYVSSLVTLTATFVNLSGIPTNPSTVTLIVTAPDGTQTSYPTPSNPTTGTYTQVLNALTEVGSYSYEWSATGATIQNPIQPGTFQSFSTPLAGPSPVDFITLSQLKTWIQSMTTAPSPDDGILAIIITAVSQDMLTRMGRTSIADTDYKEWYDGTGTPTLPVDQWPIITVNTLQIGGLTILPSPDHIQPGYVISRNNKFIELIGGGFVPGYGVPFWYRSGMNTKRGQVFPYGISNIYVDYNAGFTAVPFDLAEACLMIIDQTYKRRGWVDMAQIAIPQGGGTTTYRQWEIPPTAWKIMNNYTRTYRL